VPSGDIVDLFVEYTKNRRSTVLYRKWSAIAMIGGAMESRIDSWFGTFHNYANLFVMLIGDPGMGKGVIKITADLWKNAKDEIGLGAFHVGSNDYTKASLLDHLQHAERTHPVTKIKYHSLLLANDEFANTFPTYDPAFLSFLSTVYDADQDYEERRRKHGVDHPLIITNPIMTCLIGYQGALLHKILIKEANDQGLLRRTILIWNEHISTDSLLEGSPPDQKIKQYICSYLFAISKMAGTMTWETDGNGKDITKTIIDKWEQAGAVPRPLHPHLASYVRSRPQLLMKLSMIASMSESLDMCIRPRHVERALDWLLEAEVVMPKVFDSVKPANSDNDIVQAFYAYALKTQSGNIESGESGKELTSEDFKDYLSTKVPVPRIDYYINHMVAIGSFKREPNGKWRVTGRVPKIF
jgi:hypothetical protein